MAPYRVNLDIFSGPMDLLLYLVRKEEVDIYDIPIARITAEFVRYVRQGGKIATSAIAARNSVAAGCMAAESLRHGGVPMDIPGVPQEIADYFNADLLTTV